MPVISYLRDYIAIIFFQRFTATYSHIISPYMCCFSHYNSQFSKNVYDKKQISVKETHNSASPQKLMLYAESALLFSKSFQGKFYTVSDIQLVSVCSLYNKNVRPGSCTLRQMHRQRQVVSAFCSTGFWLLKKVFELKQPRYTTGTTTGICSDPLSTSNRFYSNTNDFTNTGDKNTLNTNNLLSL